LEVSDGRTDSIHVSSASRPANHVDDTRRKRLGAAALFAVAMGVLYGMLKKLARRARPLPPPPPAPPPPPPPAGDADATIPGA